MPEASQLRIASIVLAFYVAAALAALAVVIGFGPLVLPLFDLRVLGRFCVFGLRLDPLSTSVLLMVTVLAAVVGHYARRYLAGDRGQGRFYRYLMTTTASVALFVLASNLVMAFFAWWLMSWGIHRLLLHYPQRPGAVLAARKKFIVSRIGDVALVGAIILVARVFGTVDYGELFSLIARGTAQLSPSQRHFLGGAGLLFVLGAMTKSAQLPFHFWLPETMETPTPVSALMHAGVINAGGYLIIRLSPLLVHTRWALFTLAVVGATTAVFGSLVMMTQNDIKKKLAYSTISQMGLMMLACGLGAFSLALLHIFSHSFYKAQAFLATGTLVEESRRAELEARQLSWTKVAAAALLGAGLVALGCVWRGGAVFPLLTYLAVLGLGLARGFGDLHDSGNRWAVAASVSAMLAAAALVYAGLEHAVGSFVAGLMPASPAFAWSDPVVAGGLLSYGLFVLGLWTSQALLAPSSHLARRLYVLFWNGSYFGPVFTRVLSRS